ncbi:MAG: S8 family serine peptidase [Candidatus Schekmanbacteria bacterium]|nr:S8 family serine peptidase [Candidatus Schekmanbacteria bacterium]
MMSTHSGQIPRRRAVAPRVMTMAGILALAVADLAAAAANPELPTAGLRRPAHGERALVPALSNASDTADFAVLAHYGAFDLIETAAAAADPSRAPRLSAPGELDVLHLHAATLETAPTSSFPPIPPALTAPHTATAGLYLVQLVGPPQDRWLQALRDCGIALIQPFPANGYLVWAPPGALAKLVDLFHQDRSPLQYVGAYHPFYKAAAALVGEAREKSGAGAALTLNVQRYAGSDRGVLSRLLRRAGATYLQRWWRVQQYENATIRLAASSLTELLAVPDVVWVDRAAPRRRLDEIQDQVVAGNFTAGAASPAGPGYLDWLRDHGVSANPADYPIVDVVDDGIGDGTLDTGDPTLHEGGNAAWATRVAYLGDCTGDGPHGLDGHGHINASIVGGYDERSGAPFQDDNGFARALGVNPFTRLAGTRVFGDLGSWNTGSCGDGSDAALIAAVYANGARISSNSWGADAYGEYDAIAQAYDAGARDALPDSAGNQQMLFVFAAGNSGPGPATVGSPATAKNVISVGASENPRPGFVDGCGVGTEGADNLQDIIHFSSRGPAGGDRVKPEIVAPGTHIQGTASTAPAYTGYSVCDAYFPAGQSELALSSGTSHSTPAVAGASSLLHYWLRTHHTGGADPSPAAVKAYLLAHTRSISGVDATDDLPSNNQGLGLPDLGAAFDEAARIVVDQSVTLGETGGSWEVFGGTAENDRPTRIVLTWTDAPGAAYADPQVNDLDLEVFVDGELYRGNHFAGPWSSPGGDSDRANNFEAVYLPAGVMGGVRIRVVAAAIAGDGVPQNADATDQDFALVAYNVSQAPGFYLAADDDQRLICGSGELAFALTVGQISGFDETVALEVVDLPSFMTVDLAAAVSPPANTVMALSIAAGAPVGPHELTIRGTSGELQRFVSVSVRVDEKLAGTSLLVPFAGQIAVPPRSELFWSALESADLYRVQLARDAELSDIVLDELTAATSLRLPALDGEKIYYWRVGGRNSCGDGESSDAQPFETAARTVIACPVLPLAIPDTPGGPATCSFEVEADYAVTDVELAVAIEHDWPSDLELSLAAPDPDQDAVILHNHTSTAMVGSFDDTLAVDGPGEMDDFIGQSSRGLWWFSALDTEAADDGVIDELELTLTGTTRPAVKAVAQAEVAACPGESSVAHVVVSTLNGYSGNATVALRPGSGVVTGGGQGPVTVSVPGTADLPLTIDDGAEPGAYSAGIKTVAGNFAIDGTIPVVVSAPITETPTPYDPQDGAILLPVPAFFAWYSVSNATSYRLQIAGDSGFQQIVRDHEVANPDLTVDSLEAGSYYFRVFAINGCGTGEASPAVHFSVAADMPICGEAAVEIPDGSANGAYCALPVDASGRVTDLNLDVVIRHPFTSDLTVDLISPRQTTVRLWDLSWQDGGDVAGNFDLTLVPSGPGGLDDFNDEPASGIWLLHVCDLVGWDLGVIETAQIHIASDGQSGGDAGFGDATEVTGEAGLGDAPNRSAVAVGGDGIVHIVWEDRRAAPARVYYARSLDHGLTFAAGIPVDDAAGSGEDQLQPDIAVSPDGTVHVVWQDQRSGNPDIYAARLVPGAVAFDDSTRVDDTGTAAVWQASPAVVVSPSGWPLVAWHDYRYGDPDIYFARSRDGGSSFEANVRLNDDGIGGVRQKFPAIDVAPDGAIFVAWQDERFGGGDVHAAVSRDFGLSFEANVRISEETDTFAADWAVDTTAPAVLVDRLGQVHVAWAAAAGAGSTGVNYRRSTDGGASFWPRLTLGQGTTGTGHPSLAGRNGHIYVAWSSVSGEGQVAIDAAVSLDAGQSFGSSSRVSRRAEAANLLPDMAIDTVGTVYAAWNEQAQGESRIVVAAGGATRVPVSGGAGLLMLLAGLGAGLKRVRKRQE